MNAGGRKLSAFYKIGERDKNEQETYSFNDS